MRAGVLLWCVVLAALVLVPDARAATFACEVRASCLSNQTLLIRLNSSETGQTPNNSHAQLANYTGTAYPYSVCCWTDAYRALNNTCTGNSLRVLGLESTNNSHVQAGTNATYAWSACLNVTPADLTCEYQNSACSAGYTGILSIASSEPGDNTTNAHVAEFLYYTRRVCCAITGLTPPAVAFANLTPINTTKRQDLLCGNGTVSDADGDTVTLHYNWYRNGTSVTVLGLPMDYDDVSGVTHDISGYANHGAVNGSLFLPVGGQVGGAFSFDGSGSISVGNDTELAIGTGAFSIAAWVLIGFPQSAAVIDKKNGTGVTRGYGLFLTAGSPRLTVADGSSSSSATGSALVNDEWTHIVALRNASGLFLYQQGSLAGSSASGGDYDLRNPIAAVIGANSSLVDYNINGRIDELMVFGRALTPAEIDTLYRTNNQRLNRSEMQKSDLWNCSITPVDSTGLNGSTAFSNGSFVNASTPLEVNLSYPAHNNQSVFERFVNFSWTAADEPDGDQVNYTLYTVVAPGACGVQATVSNIQTTNYTYGELCVDQLYNWTVRACDVDGCSANTTIFNFTVASVIGIALNVNATEFGTLALGQSNTTDGPGGPPPLVLENTGNVLVNVTLNASQSPFASVGLGDTAFQYRVAANETGSLNASGSQTTYTPVPSGVTHAIKQLNHSDAADAANVHTNITVPGAEPPGAKTTNLTFRATITT